MQREHCRDMTADQDAPAWSIRIPRRHRLRPGGSIHPECWQITGGGAEAGRLGKRLLSLNQEILAVMDEFVERQVIES